MTKMVALTLLSLAAVAACAVAEMNVKADHWAILVAGSNGYGNYRHHADTCHAYQLLVASGVPPAHVITMFYDDVAGDPSNPFPGQLYNKPTPDATGGVDVYAGCKKSYTGDSVTPANFLAVLTGNASAVDCGSNAPVCTREVLNSTAKDFVFWAFFDHGGAGLVAFPAGGYLYQPDLWAGLSLAHELRLYRQLTVYMEACESGSMFDGYPTDRDTYITTASDPNESSWGTYCPPEDQVNGTDIGSCLGDLYSVSWMEDAQVAGHMKESLQSNYVEVAALTNLSHVMQYGTQEWTDEPIGDFLGNASTVTEGPTVAFSRRALAATERPEGGSHWNAREATILSLRIRAGRTPPGTALGDSLATQLKEETRRAANWDRIFTYVGAVLPPGTVTAPLETATWTAERWACLKGGVDAFESCGGPLGDYGLGYVRHIAALCGVLGEDTGTVRVYATAACEYA